MISSVLKKICYLYKKYKSIILYVFFGGLTTLISICSFAFANSWLKINALIANVISWTCAVTFAYITNRIWVFQSKAKGKQIFTEALLFYSGRLLTLGIEELIFLVFVTWLHMNSLMIKVIAQIIVLVSNYIISKVLVFRKKKDN